MLGRSETSKRPLRRSRRPPSTRSPAESWFRPETRPKILFQKPSRNQRLIQFTPDVEKKLKDIAAQSGRGTADELVKDVVEGYFDELAQRRGKCSTAAMTT